MSSSPVDVSYELYLAVKPSASSQSEPDPHQSSNSTPANPCSRLMADHLAVAASIYADPQDNLNLNLLGAVSNECASYTPIIGQLATFTNDTAEDIFMGPQRGQAIDDFLTKMKGEGFYQEDSINVYYVWHDKVSGLHVRKLDRFSENLVFIGGGARPDSLAHELAHAFSLEHVNFFDASDLQNEFCAEYEYFDNRCDFTSDNLMWVARDPEDEPEERSELHYGQKLRIMCNRTSALVDNGDFTPDVTMDCPDWSVEGGCPPLNP